ncbi:MAG: c-type cytochrome [Actinomycetota bacterium]
MKKENQRKITLALTLATFVFYGALTLFGSRSFVSAQTNILPTPTPTPPAAAVEFNQAAALAKLKEQIKGKEQEPAEKVFKNIQMLKTVPAGRLLAIMEFGYARSLGVACTYCHTPEKWEAEGKNTKQITREMAAMVGTINSELLKNIKNLKSESPIINCTTCHRGQVKPALNLPVPTQKSE